ncbi:MAG: D-aminoacyl-tRNA deacylase [Candidatus Anstonellales archaeon]
MLEVDNLLDFSCNDECIVLSPHRSKDKKPAITVHIPGNAGKAHFYGMDFMLNISNPVLMFRIFIETHKLLEQNREEIKMTYEADHHGPNIEKPILFYELGSTEQEWANKDLCILMANALKNALSSNEMPSITACYFGGNHYASRCNELTIKNGYAFSHIIAKYSLDETNENVVKQALEKTTQKIDIAIIEKDGTKRIHKDKIIPILEQLGVDYKLL